jgi:hypothetical protein
MKLLEKLAGSMPGRYRYLAFIASGIDSFSEIESK